MMNEEKVERIVSFSPLIKGEMQEGGVSEQRVSHGIEPLRFVHEHPLPYRSGASTGRPSAADPLTRGRSSEEPKIGIIIVIWNSEKFIPALLESLQKVNYPSTLWRVFFVDNGSGDGTLELLKQLIHPHPTLSLSRERDISSPPSKGERKREGVLIENEHNVGFARACNQGAEAAITWGAEYLYFLNPDTEVDKDFLEEALKVFQDNNVTPSPNLSLFRERNIGPIGQVQSLTLREGGKEIQSWGNCLTFLGFGYSGGDGELIERHPHLASSPFLGRGNQESSPPSKGEREREGVYDIGYASGAAMMVPTKVWREVGGFDEIYESFHEDTDLSLKIRLAGYRVVLAPASQVIHKYQFARSIRNYYYMERNRFILGLKFFKIPTLLLFLPAFIIMEVGTFGYSVLTGFWKEKLKAYLWLIFYLERIWARRIVLQRTRKRGDRELVKYLVAKVEFQEVMNPVLEYVVNPVMEVYWKVVRRIIRW